MNDDRLKSLLAVKREVNAVLFKHRDKLNEMRTISDINDKPETNMIIDFARRISLTTRAPPLWKPGFPLDISYGHGPCPQFEELAGGYLRGHQIESKSLIADAKKRGKQSSEVSTPLVDSNKESHVNLTDILKYLDMTLPEASSLISKPTMKEAPTTADKANPSIKRAHEEIPAIEPIAKKTRQINLSFGLSDSEDED